MLKVFNLQLSGCEYKIYTLTDLHLPSNSKPNQSLHHKTTFNCGILIVVDILFTCVAKAKAGLGVQSKSFHRNSSETTDPIIMKLGM